MFNIFGILLFLSLSSCAWWNGPIYPGPGMFTREQMERDEVNIPMGPATPNTIIILRNPLE